MHSPRPGSRSGGFARALASSRPRAGPDALLVSALLRHSSTVAGLTPARDERQASHAAGGAHRLPGSAQMEAIVSLLRHARLASDASRHAGVLGAQNRESRLGHGRLTFRWPPTTWVAGGRHPGPSWRRQQATAARGARPRAQHRDRLHEPALARLRLLGTAYPIRVPAAVRGTTGDECQPRLGVAGERCLQFGWDLQHRGRARRAPPRRGILVTHADTRQPHSWPRARQHRRGPGSSPSSSSLIRRR